MWLRGSETDPNTSAGRGCGRHCSPGTEPRTSFSQVGYKTPIPEPHCDTDSVANKTKDFAPVVELYEVLQEYETSLRELRPRLSAVLGSSYAHLNAENSGAWGASDTERPRSHQALADELELEVKKHMDGVFSRARSSAVP